MTQPPSGCCFPLPTFLTIHFKQTPWGNPFRQSSLIIFQNSISLQFQNSSFHSPNKSRFPVVSQLSSSASLFPRSCVIIPRAPSAFFSLDHQRNFLLGFSSTRRRYLFALPSRLFYISQSLNLTPPTPSNPLTLLLGTHSLDNSNSTQLKSNRHLWHLD